MDFLIFVFSLFLDIAVSFQAIQTRAFDGLDGFFTFLHIFRRLIKGQFAKLDLEFLGDIDTGVLRQDVDSFDAGQGG